MKWTTEESQTFKSSTKLGFWCYNKGRFVVHVGSMQSQCSNLHQWPTSWWAFTFIDGLCEADCPFKHRVLLATESPCERERTGCVPAGRAASPFKHSLDDLVSAIKRLPQSRSSFFPVSLAQRLTKRGVWSRKSSQPIRRDCNSQVVCSVFTRETTGHSPGYWHSHYPPVQLFAFLLIWMCHLGGAGQPVSPDWAAGTALCYH